MFHLLRRVFRVFRVQVFRGPIQRMVICWNRSPLPPLVACWGRSSTGESPPFECSDGSKVAIAALTPSKLKHAKVIDINDFHVSPAHAHASVMKATAEQHGVRLTKELVSCAACSMARGNRAPTPHHTTARAKRPMELVHISRGIAVRGDVCGQRITSTAPVRHPR